MIKRHGCKFEPLRSFSNGVVMEGCSCGRTRTIPNIANLDLPFEVSDARPTPDTDKRKRYRITGTKAQAIAKVDPVLITIDQTIPEDNRLWSYSV